MRHARHPEEGAIAAEQVAVVLLVAALVAGLWAAALPDRTEEASEAAVDCLFDTDPNCDIPSGGGEDDDGDPPPPEPDPDNPCRLPLPADPPPNPQQTDQGEQDAGTLAGIIDDTPGLGQPMGIAFDMGSPHFDIVPVETDEVAELYPDLVSFLDEHSGQLDDPSYAVGVVNQLGPDGVRDLMDMVNTYGTSGILEDVDDLNTPYREFVEPLATLLGAADRSGQLDPGVRDAMVNSGPPSEREILEGMDPELLEDVGIEDIDDLDLDDPDVGVHPELLWILEVQRARANAVLLEAGDFSSRTTSELAGGLLEGLPPKLDANGFTEGFGTLEFFENGEHGSSLADNRWAALQALASDPNAATLLMEDPEMRALVEKWLSDDTYDEHEILELMVERRLDLDDRDDVARLMKEAAQGSLDAECS